MLQILGFYKDEEILSWIKYAYDQGTQDQQYDVLCEKGVGLIDSARPFFNNNNHQHVLKIIPKADQAAIIVYAWRHAVEDDHLSDEMQELVERIKPLVTALAKNNDDENPWFKGGVRHSIDIIKKADLTALNHLQIEIDQRMETLFEREWFPRFERAHTPDAFNAVLTEFNKVLEQLPPSGKLDKCRQKVVAEFANRLARQPKAHTSQKIA